MSFLRDVLERVLELCLPLGAEVIHGQLRYSAPSRLTVQVRGEGRRVCQVILLSGTPSFENDALAVRLEEDLPCLLSRWPFELVGRTWEDGPACTYRVTAAHPTGS